MKILIDTHIFLWALTAPERLGDQWKQELETPANTVYVSSMSIAEINIKSGLGKLKLDFHPLEAIEKSGFEALSFSTADAMMLSELPMHHKDPFDRMIIGQAMQRKLHIMTSDSKFAQYDCKLLS